MLSSMRQRAYETIRRRVITGELAAGARLSPVELAREVGFSHIPVREALSRLHSEGLVDWKPHMGSFVAEPDPRETVELFELREMIEGGAAALAARRATDAQIAELGKIVDTMRAAAALVRRRGLKKFDRQTLVAFVAADLTFHRTILRIAGNRRALKILCDLQVISRLHFVKADTEAGDFPAIVEGSFEQHRVIFEAIRARDASLARRHMARHVRTARRDALKAMTRGPRPIPLSFVPDICRLIDRLEVEDREAIDPPAVPTRARQQTQRRIG